MYRTRDGEKVRVYAIEEREIHGSVYRNGIWEIDVWNTDGSYSASKGKEHPKDILLTPPFQLKPNTKYQSRDGRPIKVYEINSGSLEFPVIGAIKDSKGYWLPRIWNTKGITKVPYGPNNDIVSEWSES